MLDQLIRERMQKDGLSLREAAAQIGTSHGTLFRILEGQIVEMETLMMCADWLGVKPSTLIDVEAGDVTAMVSYLLERNPQLEKAFKECFDRLQRPVIDEVIWYMLWRASREE